MRLHEYQAKQIFSKHGIKIPKGKIAETPEEARKAAEELGGKVVVKAQVLVGGRGKAGGIKKASSPDEAEKFASHLLGSLIRGHKVERVLVEEAIDIKKEYYLGYVVDKSRRMSAVIFSRVGGMDIEEIAAKHPEAIHRIYFDPLWGLQDYQIRKELFKSGFSGDEFREMFKLIKTLVDVAYTYEAELTEINPLAVTDDGFVAADARLNVDDNALFRHPEIEGLRDATEVDELEREARFKGLNYVRIGGEIGIIANGAGLAMTTMDIINLMGGKPANFLDTGGGLADPEKMKKCLLHVLKDENVRTVFVNIFAEITRCEKVAEGIILALNESDRRVPLVIKLVGTNEEMGKSMLKEYAEEKDAPIYFVETIEDGAKKAVELAKEV
jgi:succinyl-CoA synthetase beta subunit